MSSIGVRNKWVTPFTDMVFRGSVQGRRPAVGEGEREGICQVAYQIRILLGASEQVRLPAGRRGALKKNFVMRHFMLWHQPRISS